MSKQTEVKAGKLLCVDQGAYSCYTVKGFFLVLTSFNLQVELAEHINANPEQGEPYDFNEDSFLAALLAKGYLLEIEYSTLFLSGNSNYTEVRVS